MIPAAAFLLIADLTCRLHSQFGDDRHQTRRVIAKLAIHFYPFANEGARNRAEAALTGLLVTRYDDRRLAWECLATCASIDREERQHMELMGKLAGLADIHDQVQALAQMMEVEHG